ncbi:MAG: hypothetical protein ACPGU7_10480 [Gammaproteobacteria bacterium]
MGKTSNYRIRVEPDLHQEFLEACKAEDRPAAQVVREFMKAYVSRHQHSNQGDFFDDAERGAQTGVSGNDR